jgi:hypothetical protein
MLLILRTSGVLFIIFFASHAENCVYEDAAFPYRIVCNTGWVVASKTDSTFVLKNQAPGKKTQFELRKYQIDTSYDSASLVNKDWSRLRFALNKELVLSIGKLIFIDTSATKKLGNFRAFEIFSFLSAKSDTQSVKTDTQTIWWGEYSRWTDHDGFGYLASIIGDTSDMKQNYATYKALMDSIGISNLNTLADSKRLFSGRAPLHVLPASQLEWHNLLGRQVSGSFPCSRSILVKKNTKRLFIKPKNRSQNPEFSSQN